MIADYRLSKKSCSLWPNNNVTARRKHCLYVVSEHHCWGVVHSQSAEHSSRRQARLLFLERLIALASTQRREERALRASSHESGSRWTREQRHPAECG